MKKTSQLTLTAALLLGGFIHASQAAFTLADSNYGASTYYTTSTSGDSIVSFDWDSSGKLFYQTSTSSYGFGGFHQYDGSTTTTITAGDDSLFPGVGVVVLGNYAYYNVSDWSGIQSIYKYDVTGVAGGVTRASTTANYGLHGYGGALYITGADNFGPNHIFHSPVGAEGSLLASATDLGQTGGGSGPLTFDSAGNLYYASGYGEFSIFKWTAIEVAAAILDPVGNALSTEDHVWLDYNPNGAGATSMVFAADGNLLVSFTNFAAPSELIRFDVDSSGDYITGSATTILTDDSRLGQISLRGGDLYVASGETIYQVTTTVVPEPATFTALAGLCVLTATLFRRRRV